MANVETQAESRKKVSTLFAGSAAVAMAFVFALLLFLPAGRADWVLGWGYVGTVISYFASLVKT